MGIEIDDAQFVRIINLFKSQTTWEKIIVKAAEQTREELEDKTIDALYDSTLATGNKVQAASGGLEESIETEVEVKDQTVRLRVKSNHPAAGILEYGGPSSFPPWGKNSAIAEYARIIGEKPFMIAKGVYDNQPFTSPTRFMTKGCENAFEDLEKNVYAVVQKELSGKKS
jgi:hypothetical protein